MSDFRKRASLCLSLINECFQEKDMNNCGLFVVLSEDNAISQLTGGKTTNVLASVTEALSRYIARATKTREGAEEICNLFESQLRENVLKRWDAEHDEPVLTGTIRASEELLANLILKGDDKDD